MQRTAQDRMSGISRGARGFGYGIAVAINLLLLVVVQNLVEWDVFTFLTAEFAQVVPWISLALVASIVANLAYLSRDDPAFKSMGEIGVNVIGLAATYRLFQVFPFDFSAFDLEWALIARILLVVAMVGSGIGVMAAGVRLGRAIDTRQPSSSSSRRS